MATNIYTVTSDFMNHPNGKGEAAVLCLPQNFGSYMEARRYISKFTNWKDQPQMVRKVTPLRVYKSFLVSCNKFQPIAIATFKGVYSYKNGQTSEVWWAIYVSKIC